MQGLPFLVVSLSEENVLLDGPVKYPCLLRDVCQGAAHRDRPLVQLHLKRADRVARRLSFSTVSSSELTRSPAGGLRIEFSEGRRELGKMGAILGGGGNWAARLTMGLKVC